MNSVRILVSVIVPVYKAEQYLRLCVESILKQTYRNIEVILVDDGSPDACPRICDEYAAADARVRVIHKENGGAGLAREAGLAEAKGEYVLFADSDDWLDHDMIESCLNTALRDSADCVMCGYIREYPERAIRTSLFSGDFSYDIEQSEKMIHRRIVGLAGEELKAPQCIDSLSSFCMKLYRTEAAKKGRIVSDLVVGTSEDTIFNLYALDNCKISYIDRCFYHYRKNNLQSITTAHKPELSEKWDVMYGIIREYIDGSGRAEEYKAPFMNRVACGMIGLGLNEVAGSESLVKKSRNIRRILNKPLYSEAFGQLDTSFCGVKWKLFFWLARHKAAFSLTVLLQIMNFLRSRMTS